jgi:hypothetical protein
MYLRLPDNSYMPIPSGMSTNEAWAKAQQQYPEAFNTADPLLQAASEISSQQPVGRQKSGFFGGVQRGGENLLRTTGTALGAITGDTGEAARYGLAKAEGQGKKYAPKMGWENVKEGFTSLSPGQTFRGLKEMTGETVPIIGTMLAGARLGAMAGTAFGGVGAIPGAVAGGLGGLAVGILPATGESLERQAQKSPEDISLGRALGAGTVSAGADVLGAGLGLPGLARRAVGQTAKQLTEAELKQVAEKGLWRSAGEGIARTSAAEFGTGALQEGAQMASAKEDIFSRQGLMNIAESGLAEAVGSAPFGAAHGLVSRSGARGQIERMEYERQQSLRRQAENDAALQQAAQLASATPPPPATGAPPASIGPYIQPPPPPPERPRPPINPLPPAGPPPAAPSAPGGAAAPLPAPSPQGYVRVYHSGSVGEGQTGRWVSTDRKYASDYRPDLPLFYIDLPANDPRVNNPDYPDTQGVKQGFTFNFELTPEEAAQLKETPRERNTSTRPAPDASPTPESIIPQPNTIQAAPSEALADLLEGEEAKPPNVRNAALIEAIEAELERRAELGRQAMAKNMAEQRPPPPRPAPPPPPPVTTEANIAQQGAPSATVNPTAAPSVGESAPVSSEPAGTVPTEGVAPSEPSGVASAPAPVAKTGVGKRKQPVALTAPTEAFVAEAPPAEPGFTETPEQTWEAQRDEGLGEPTFNQLPPHLRRQWIDSNKSAEAYDQVLNNYGAAAPIAKQEPGILGQPYTKYAPTDTSIPGERLKFIKFKNGNDFAKKYFTRPRFIDNLVNLAHDRVFENYTKDQPQEKLDSLDAEVRKILTPETLKEYDRQIDEQRKLLAKEQQSEATIKQKEKNRRAKAEEAANLDAAVAAEQAAIKRERLAPREAKTTEDDKLRKEVQAQVDATQAKKEEVKTKRARTIDEVAKRRKDEAKKEAAAKAKEEKEAQEDAAKEDQFLSEEEQDAIEAELQEELDSLEDLPDIESTLRHRTRPVQRSSYGVTKENIEKLVAMYRKGWKGMPKVEVVQRFADLPPEIQVRGQEGSPGVMNTETGTVYLVANNIFDIKDAQETLLHEVVGHYGLRTLLGSSYESRMQSIYSSHGDIKKGADARMAAAKAAGAKMSLETATEEEIALRAEKITDTAKVPWLRALVNTVKNLLRSFGIKVSMSDTEIKDLIADARRMVAEGGGAFTSALQGPVFRPAADTPQAAVNQTVQAPINFMLNAANTNPYLVNARELVRRGFLSLRPLWDIAKEAKSLGFNQIQTVEDQLRRAGAMKEGIDRRNDAFIEKMDKFAKANPALYKRMADFMNTASRYRIDVRQSASVPATTLDPETRAVYSVLRAEWTSLPREAKDMSNALIDEYKRFRNEYFTALKKSIREQYEGDDTRIDAMITKLERTYDSFNPYYIPFVRVGDYWVNYTEPVTGERVSEAYETLAEQANRVKELHNRSIAAEAFKQVDFRKYSYKSGPVNQFFEEVKRDVIRALPTYTDMTPTERQQTLATREALLERLYQSSLILHPESSLLRQFEMQRKGVLGFIEDPLRAYAIKSRNFSAQISQVAHKGKIEKALQDAKQQNNKNPNPAMSEILTHVADLIYAKDTTDSDATFNKVANAVNRLGFMWYMGLSPASAAANMLQTPMVGYPVLAGKFRGNPVKTFATLSKAFVEVVKEGANKQTFGEKFVAAAEDKLARGVALENLSEMERLFYELDRAGVMNAGSPMHDLDMVSQYGASEASKLERGFHAGVKMSGVMFQRAEAINREATALAAYRIAKERAGGGRMTEAQFAKAISDASEVVTQAHGDYQHGLAPKVFLDPKMRVALMFKKFPAHMAAVYARLFREMFDKNADPEVRKIARIQFTGMMGMSGLFSGVMGMPFYYIVRDIMNRALGDDDDPYDFDYEMYLFLHEQFGADMANRITRGWVGDFGADVGTRVSYESSPLLGGSKKLPFIGGLLGLRDPRTNATGEETMKDFIAEAVGPAAGMPLQVARGFDKLAQGDVYRFLEGITPLAGARNVVKFLRMNEEGALTSRGDPIIQDMTEVELALQAAGFTPQRLSSQYRLNAQKKDIEQQVKARKQSLLNQYFNAQNRGDAETTGEIMQEIQQFNSANPYKGLAITGNTLQKSARTRMKQKAQTEGGIYIAKEFRPLFANTPTYAEEED